ncbi:FAD-dependent oxidoreductase [Burkholderia sp. PAMC 26561]|uniref:FAD-dependent oxidoreductase n=1 Tax=Burkholderia sp. PAMC 26561 TaxID=1795043 RepID=UPI00076B71EF|nr:FAD-dependent oxidoreductase [Burkholderia sp. PAMC 26561]AME28285.1 hypothetical protein AXG89_31155 [Burkholderia sp. PAMC 26561]
MYDVLVIGHGAAGLAAAISAAESASNARVVVLERMSPDVAGGNTRWSPSNMRMSSVDEVAPGFEDDMMAASGGRGDRSYFRKLAEQAPDTLAWAVQHGVQFKTMDYFLKGWPTRIQPVGRGAAIVEALRESAIKKGVEFVYECRAQRLVMNSSGSVEGVETVDGRRFAAKAVVLASGGFQGDPAMLRAHFGPLGETLRMISPGTAHDSGEGIRMGLDAGAVASGDWNGMHIEPVDPRSERPAALVIVYPFGIVVDVEGHRFFDEGAGLVHETWEQLSRTIHFEKPQSVAWTIFDSKLHEVAGYENAIRSDVPPLQSDSISGLASLAGIPPVALEQSIARYNEACTGEQATFEASRRDGLSTAGLLRASPTGLVR